MFGDKKWREERKAKKIANQDPYDREEQKIQQLLKELKAGTPEYETAQKQLKSNIALRAESRESKRHISKEAKGNILLKGLAMLGGIAGVGTIVFAEWKGMTFTGEKRKFMDSFSSCLGRIFFNR